MGRQSADDRARKNSSLSSNVPISACATPQTVKMPAVRVLTIRHQGGCPFESFCCRPQRFFFFGKAKPDDPVIGSVLVKSADRNGGHTHVSGDPDGKLLIGQ
jgi:hypothetical protein